MMQRYVFSEEDAPRVLIATPQECAGGDCASCPGIFNTGDTAEPVFCVHACHLKPEAA